MIGLHNLTAPIPHDPELFKYLQAPLNTEKGLEEALTNLQGNILKGHGRSHSVQILLTFKQVPLDGVKAWIQHLAESITCAQQQLEDAQRFHYQRIPGPLFVNFFLSASGYKELGFTKELGQLDVDHRSFVRGMKAGSHRLNDPYEEAWEEEYRHDIHAMVLLADNDEHSLRWEVHKRLEDIKACAEVRAIEHGRMMWNSHGQSIEHFGYADSLSQPLFFQQDIDQLRKDGKGTDLWNPGVGLDTVLVKDPFGRDERDCGSYLVFRKLEQNVRGYKEREQALANTLGFTGEGAKRAGALVVGRFEDGTPTVAEPTAGQPTNDFTYYGDPEGQKCPFQAHIRKMNPRQAGVPRIVRRGIPYGERWKEPRDNPSLDELPSRDVGLLFMCFQSNIETQFEALQYLWANDPRLPHMQEPGIDPLIGQPGALGTGEHRWPAQWNDPRASHKEFNFRGFVTLKGGEYFFAPSINFLKTIGTRK